MWTISESWFLNCFNLYDSSWIRFCAGRLNANHIVKSGCFRFNTWRLHMLLTGMLCTSTHQVQYIISGCGTCIYQSCNHGFGKGQWCSFFIAFILRSSKFTLTGLATTLKAQISTQDQSGCFLRAKQTAVRWWKQVRKIRTHCFNICRIVEKKKCGNCCFQLPNANTEAG